MNTFVLDEREMEAAFRGGMVMTDDSQRVGFVL